MARPGMKVGDNEHTIVGDMLEVGDKAPDFKLIGNDWKTRTLADYEGKVKILSFIPSIDTGVCSAQTRRFNAEAATLSEVAVLTISADLPFALRRFCGNEGIDNTETLSIHKDPASAEAYGVFDTEWNICQRAVIVLDRDNTVKFTNYVPIMGNEVDFEAALATAKDLA